MGRSSGSSRPGRPSGGCWTTPGCASTCASSSPPRAYPLVLLGMPTACVPDTPRTGAPMDAIVLLKDDHKLVEKLFKQFEKAGDEAFTEKRAIVDQVIAALTQHAFIEE